MPIGRFLNGVAAFVWATASDKYLLLHRVKTKDFASDVWECVTGRVEQGESYIDALNREVQEEIGVSVAPICLLGVTHFFRGAVEPQNELLGVVFGCELPENAPILLNDEHDAYCWVTYQQARSVLCAEDPSTQWMKRVLEKAACMRKVLPAVVMQFNQQYGFELD